MAVDFAADEPVGREEEISSGRFTDLIQTPLIANQREKAERPISKSAERRRRNQRNKAGERRKTEINILENIKRRWILKGDCRSGNPDGSWDVSYCSRELYLLGTPSQAFVCLCDGSESGCSLAGASGDSELSEFTTEASEQSSEESPGSFKTHLIPFSIGAHAAILQGLNNELIKEQAAASPGELSTDEEFQASHPHIFVVDGSYTRFLSCGVASAAELLHLRRQRSGGTNLSCNISRRVKNRPMKRQGSPRSKREFDKKLTSEKKLDDIISMTERVGAEANVVGPAQMALPATHMGSAPHLTGGQTSAILATKRVGAEACVEGLAQKPGASDLTNLDSRGFEDQEEADPQTADIGNPREANGSGDIRGYLDRPWSTSIWNDRDLLDEVDPIS